MSENDNPTAEQALTPKQGKLIEALLTPLNIGAAAKVAGIGEATARRWLKNSSFNVAYKAAQKQLFNQALNGLLLRVDRAVETLDRNMSGEDVPASVQVRSAQIVIEQAVQVHKMGELEERFSELEQLVRGPGRAT